MELSELLNKLWEKYEDGYYEEVFVETRKWFNSNSRVSYDYFTFFIALSSLSNIKIEARVFWNHLIYENKYDIFEDKIYENIRKDFSKRWEELIYEEHDARNFWSIFYKEIRLVRDSWEYLNLWIHLEAHEWQKYLDFIGDLDKARMNENYAYLINYTEDFEKSIDYILGYFTYQSSAPYFAKECMIYHVKNKLAQTINEFIDEGRIEHIRGKWVNEFKLYLKIKDYFKQHEVIHQGSPYFLDGQRFDIWIPELKVAVEYNGTQHYEAVDFFGGEEGLKSTIKRDKLKRQKCLNNNIKMIEVKKGYNFNQLIKEIQES